MDSTLKGLMIAVAVGTVIWLVQIILKNTLTSRLDIIYGKQIQTQAELTEHVNRCNEIPKSLIIEKIENLDSKLDQDRAHSQIFRQDIKLELAEINKKYDSLTSILLRRSDGRRAT